MKILCVISSFLPQIGGAELAVHNLAEGYKSLGHDVVVYTTTKSNNVNFEHTYDLYRLDKIPRGLTITRTLDTYLTQKLLRFAASWRPDVIHVHYAWPFGYAALHVRSKLGCPVFITSHGADIQRTPEINYGYRLKPWINRHVCNTVISANGLIAISEEIYNEFIVIGAKREGIIRLPNSINYSLIASPIDKLQARANLNLPADRPVIVAVGRNHPKKRFAELIRIIAIAALSTPNILCVIVGYNTKLLENYVSAAKLENNVLLRSQATPIGCEAMCGTQMQMNILDYYKAADMYIIPSSVEGLPVATIEAMASGLPILAANKPGLKDLVIDGQNGKLIDFDDLEGFAQIINEWSKDYITRDSLGKASQKQAMDYDREIVAQKHLAFFKSAGKLNVN